ncbi:MAG: NUDIX hydrolase, partial [Marivirga sp.]|nr:NUDIX hydrolase [Marivirga sp.]
MNSEIAQIYGNRLRVRVCGLCWEGNKLLLVNHKSLGPANFWAPPGGGVEYGESLESALKREFEEETGIQIDLVRFAFGSEYIHDPLHAIELFFLVKQTGGELAGGYDPEIQVIQGANFFSDEEIALIPAGEIHGIFQFVGQTKDL